jgi:hypothetical protein
VGITARPLRRVIANLSIMDEITDGRSRSPARPGEISIAITAGIRLPR